MTMMVTDTATEERAAIVEAVREFTQQAIAPQAAENDANKHFPTDTLAEAGQLGLGGVYVGEEYGSGLSRSDAIAIFEELAKGDTALAAYISIHNMVAWMVDAFGSDEVRAEWLPGLTNMTKLGSYCLTEPGAGSDAAAITTSAQREGDDYILNGSKQFISGAGSSAVYLVMARTGEPGARGMSAILVPADTEGLSFGANEHKMGWNTQPTRQVFFENVRVPVSNRLGAEGQGFHIAMKGLNGGRVNVAACSLGGAQWAFEQTVAYVKEREAFGGPLTKQQTIVFALADMKTQLSAARLLLEEAARKMDTDAPDLVEYCALTKQFVTDACFTVANQALQLHGGYGYLHEYGIERVVRDLRVHQILEGTNEIMRQIVGRAVIAA